MDVSTLEELKDEYPTSSWALWSPDFPNDGCVEEDAAELFEYIKNNRTRLRPSVVLLSLNPSTKLPSDYLKFHSTEPKHRNDQFRDHVEEAGLEGAYMTDLVERVVDADSGNVDPTADDVENLLDQLELFEQETYYVLCFHERCSRRCWSTVVRDHENSNMTLELFEASKTKSSWSAIGSGSTPTGERTVTKSRVTGATAFLSSEIIGGELTDLSQWID